MAILKQVQKANWFGWRPTGELLVVIGSWVLVVGAIFTATVMVGTEAWGGMAYFFLYAVLGATVFGVGIPLLWTVVKRKRPVADLGITTRRLWLSLGLQAVFAAVQFVMIPWAGGFPPFERFLPLLALALTIGFFEAVFWRGWVLLRLEAAFGIIPAILLGSLLYAAYHIGYNMPLSEMTFLFFIGVMYALVFRLTKNIFILWPVFQPMGQLATLMKDGLNLPLISALGFAEVLVAMLALVWLADRYTRRQAARRAQPAAAGAE